MKQTQWRIQAKKADFEAIGAEFGISAVTARLIRNRNVTGSEAINRYLNGKIDALYDPMLLPDMEKALLLLKQKIEEGKPIRIVGDYDIDGICSTYLLYRALCRVGARRIMKSQIGLKMATGLTPPLSRRRQRMG